VLDVDGAVSGVELYAAIRRDARAGLSNRALQRKHGVGCRTVVAALESAWPKERKPVPKRGPRLDPYRGVIDEWPRQDLDAPRKQQHTAKWIFDRLLDEHDAIEVSYWMVRSTSPRGAGRSGSRPAANQRPPLSRKNTCRAGRPR